MVSECQQVGQGLRGIERETLRVDRHGNVWTSAGDGVRCYAPDGTLLGLVRIPEVVANCCFGGAKRNRLFICGTTSLYAVYLNTAGA